MTRLIIILAIAIVIAILCIEKPKSTRASRRIHQMRINTIKRMEARNLKKK